MPGDKKKGPVLTEIADINDVFNTFLGKLADAFPSFLHDFVSIGALIRRFIGHLVDNPSKLNLRHVRLVFRIRVEKFPNDGVGRRAICGVGQRFLFFRWKCTQILCIEFPKAMEAVIRESAERLLCVSFCHRGTGR